MKIIFLLRGQKTIISEKQCHNISVMNYLLNIKRK